MAKRVYLAVDLGAKSGRVMAGTLADAKVRQVRLCLTAASLPTTLLSASNLARESFGVRLLAARTGSSCRA